MFPVSYTHLDFEMYLDSMSQMKKMGGLSSVMGMMPGMGIGGGKMPDIDTDEAEKGMARTEAIIYSMTPEERRNPKLLNPSRKARIARGAVSYTHLELIQGRHEQLSYELIDESGPDHDKQFTVAVLVDGERVSEGEGHTKKAAEQQAAYQALLLYRNRE